MFYSLAVGINMSRDVTKTTSQLSLRGTHSGPAPSVRLREASKWLGKSNDRADFKCPLEVLVLEIIDSSPGRFLKLLN